MNRCTCTSTTSRTLLNFKVIGQRSSHIGLCVFFSVCVWCCGYPWTVLSLEQGLMILLQLVLVLMFSVFNERCRRCTKLWLHSGQCFCSECWISCCFRSVLSYLALGQWYHIKCFRSVISYLALGQWYHIKCFRSVISHVALGQWYHIKCFRSVISHVALGQWYHIKCFRSMISYLALGQGYHIKCFRSVISHVALGQWYHIKCFRSVISHQVL